MFEDRPGPDLAEVMVASSCSGGDCGSTRPYRIGCALLPKKVSRYLTPKMLRTARARGVELSLIDYTRSLLDQGPYDAIVHKLRPNLEWERFLQEYVRARPHVKVIDSMSGIRTLQNRATMLGPLKGDGIALQRPPGWTGPPGASVARVQSPVQVEIVEGTSLAEAQRLLQAAGLHPPLLVKPLWTDGREGSHGLAVLHDMAALGRVLGGQVSGELKPPLVLQEFVKHGGVLFKVYVLGMRTVCCRRPSLGDSYLGPEAQEAGVLSLPRISCKQSYVPARDSVDGLVPAGPLGLEEQQRLLQQQLRPQQQQEAHRAHPHARQPSSGEVEGLGAVTPGSSDSSFSAAAGAACAGNGGGPEPCSGEGAAAASGAAAAAAAAGAARGGLARTSAGFCMGGSAADMPPEWCTHGLAQALASRLGMQLFNFDLICPEEQSNPDECLYYVVDCNYFPGVDKIPNFESLFVDFLLSTVSGNGNSNGCNGGNGGSSPGRVAARSPGCAPPALGSGEQQQQALVPPGLALGAAAATSC